MKILVTGGAGFIGSTLVKKLLERSVHTEVIVLDDFSTGHKENLPFNSRLEVLEGSVTNSEVEELVAKTDLVFHLAARNIITSTKNPREDYETNIGGTLNVLQAARAAGGVKVVYASSASVYGNPRHLPIHEDDPLSTLSPYSVSKLAGENYCRAFYESYDVPTVALRYSNVYGPGQSYGVVPAFMRAAMSGEPLKIHGDGEQTRDFTFVDDVVEVTMKAGLKDRGVGEVFNVASGIETSVNELADNIILEARSVGFPKPTRLMPVENRDIDNIRRRVLNIERLRRVFRFMPRRGLAAGINQTMYFFHESVKGESNAQK